MFDPMRKCPFAGGSCTGEKCAVFNKHDGECAFVGIGMHLHGIDAGLSDFNDIVERIAVKEESMYEEEEGGGEWSRASQD